MSLKEHLQEEYLTNLGNVVVYNLRKKPESNRALQTLMTRIRDKKTDRATFRKLVREVYELYILPDFLETLPTERETITTGNNVSYIGERFRPWNIWMIDIPRAGTYPTESIMDKLAYLLYSNGEGFNIQKAIIDVKRIEKDGQSIYHDVKRVSLPKAVDGLRIVILDPMLATGGTCYIAISKLHEHVSENRHRILHAYIGSIIGVPEGILKVAELLDKFSIPAKIVLAAVDPKLDESKYIVPGLGDAGDRLYF